MSTKSDIEWTDATWNPVVGCAKVSAGCKHCYAETMAARHVLMSRAQGRTSPYLPVVDVHERKNPQTGKTEWVRRWNGRAVCLPERLTEPLSWRKPRRVFVNSMSDLFHEDVPFEFVAAVFGVMAASKRHAFQVLTKRPERMLEFFAWMETQAGERVSGTGTTGHGDLRAWVLVDAASKGGAPAARWTSHPPSLWEWPLPNVWLGVSAEDQATADERIPLLLQAPAAVRFVSAEPLLGPLYLNPRDIDGPAAQALGVARLDWVIVGGESGPGARPCHVSWVRSLVSQCQEASVAVFVKQLGARPDFIYPLSQQPAESMVWHRKGGDPDEWPADLRVRQLPEVRGAG